VGPKDSGVGKRAETIIPSPDPSWVPELSKDQIYEFDLDKARSLLEDAGYKDTDGDGVREMPGGGQPLKFTAAIETVPPFDPGELSTLTAARPSTTISDESVDEMLQRLRERGAKYEPVEGRSVADGDTVVLDIERRDADGGASPTSTRMSRSSSAPPPTRPGSTPENPSAATPTIWRVSSVDSSCAASDLPKPQLLLIWTASCHRIRDNR